jgi:2-polyprenyl-6-methoxyphenol hydroxylase-like FAD-dependent oxidoreductase
MKRPKCVDARSVSDEASDEEDRAMSNGLEQNGAGSPVLVVGAGPVGLTAAAELARYGVPVRIIDKSPEATETSKALVVWSRTLELMDRMGCTDAFLTAGVHAKGAAMHHGGTVLGRTTFDAIPSRYNFACMVPQSDTERLLTEHLGRFGVVIERRVELLGFTQADGSVTCRLQHPDGRIEELDTPWLVGCDGAHSTVRHGLDLQFDGYMMDDDWILADVRLEGPGTPPADEIGVFFHDDGPFVIFPMPAGRARVIATVGKADGQQSRPEPTLGEVQALIDARTGGGFQATDPVWLSGFRINERKVKRYRDGRVLLAGDAAHVHSPAGGQGMNTGMQDAINLAWKLALVTRGRASPSLLDTYSSERTAIGDLVLRNAARLTDMATLSNPAAQLLRNAAVHVMLGFDAVKHRMAEAMSETDIAYPKSALSVGPHAGARLDPGSYGGLPPGAGAEPRFVMYTDDREDGRTLAARYPDLLADEPRPALDGVALTLVRPDGYLGFVARRNDWDGAARYLDNLQPVAS